MSPKLPVPSDATRTEDLIETESCKGGFHQAFAVDPTMQHLIPLLATLLLAAVAALPAAEPDASG
jgi:hypothetical protein